MARKKGESAELLAPDPVLETMNRWAAFIQKHLKPLAGVVFGVFAVLIGYELFSHQSEHDAAVVTSELTDGVRAYDQAVDPQKVFTSTRAGALDADLERAREKLATVQKDHPSSGAAQLAKLYEADIDRRLHKFAESEALYKSYIAEARSDDDLLFVAIEGAGYAAEDQNKLDDALAQYEKLASGSGFYKDYGLKHKARILEKKGDTKGAAAALKTIVEMQPPSDLRGQAEEHLKTLE